MQKPEWKNEIDDNALRIVTLRWFAQPAKSYWKEFCAVVRSRRPRALRCGQRQPLSSLGPVDATTCEYAFELEPFQPRCRCGVRLGRFSGVGHENRSSG